jgi:uncharacterized membrane protein YoaK (UPF0700 family)
MKTNKIVGFILQIPMYALILGSFVASIYAAYAKIQGITWATPIILLIVIITYIAGKILYDKDSDEESQ